MAEITKQELVDFETEICNIYRDGKIRAPIHLPDGNEEQLMGGLVKHVPNLHSTTCLERDG